MQLLINNLRPHAHTVRIDWSLRPQLGALLEGVFDVLAD
jgi:hypothetical protein